MLPPPPPMLRRAGRRRLLYSGAFLCGVASIMAATAPSLWMYLAFRCASGAGMGGMAVAAFALAADVAPPSWRGFVGLLINPFFSGKQGRAGRQARRSGTAGKAAQRALYLECSERGFSAAACNSSSRSRMPASAQLMSMPPSRRMPPCFPCEVGACAATLLAWWVPSWRWLTFLCGIATLAYIPSWSLVAESPQWLLLRSKKVGEGRQGAAFQGYCCIARAVAAAQQLAPPLLRGTERCHGCLACLWMFAAAAAG
jgi:MFS family permease